MYQKVTIFSNIEPRTVSTNWLIADAISYEDFPKTQLNLRQVLGELSMKKSLISKRGFPSDMHGYNRLFSVGKHNYGNYFLHIIVCSEISLTMAQEKDSLMLYWCKLRMFKTI